MNVLLINSDFSTLTDSDIMPLTMYSLGAVLREKGHDIKIIDPLLYRSGYYTESLTDVIQEICCDFDVIAFSANTLSWAYVRKSVELIRKRNYYGQIVVGGVHATRECKSLFKNTNIDFVVLGEGELSFPALLDAIKNNTGYENVPGIAYEQGADIKMTEQRKLIELNESIPLPAYDLVPPNAYKVFTFESSRGCYADCSFCSIIYKKCWRGFSSDIVLNRLKKASETFLGHTVVSDGKQICFTDDCFTSNKKRAKEILSLMKDSYTDYRFLIEARMRHLLDEELIEIIKSFPYIDIQVGVERGYDEGLQKIKKGISIKDIEQCSQMMCDNDLTQNAFFSFIIGMPGETKEEILKTIKTVRNLRYSYGIRCNCVWWIPFPSPELDVLKSMPNGFSEEIFDTVDWHLDNELFKNIRSHLSVKDIAEITELMNR